MIICSNNFFFNLNVCILLIDLEFVVKFLLVIVLKIIIMWVVIVFFIFDILVMFSLLLNIIFVNIFNYF